MKNEPRLVIAKKHYPFEMYCLRCNTIIAYCVHKALPGDLIMVRGLILLDGTAPVPGEVIVCDCPRFGPHQYGQRERA